MKLKLPSYRKTGTSLWPRLLPACLLAGLLLLTQVACFSRATPTPTPTPAEHTPPADLRSQVGGLPVQVQVGEVTLGPGETGRVALLATGVTDADGVGGFELQVNYDPTVVNVVGVLAGDAAFTTSTGYIIANPDNTAGVLRIVGIQPQIPGPVGELVLAYLEVKAVGNPGAVSALDLLINGLIDSQGFYILTQAVVGQVSLR